MGLELEVGLHAIYLNQPMFHDVVKAMDEKDFVFIDIVLQNMSLKFKDAKLLHAIFVLKKRVKRFETYRRISDIISKFYGSEYNHHALY